MYLIIYVQICEYEKKIQWMYCRNWPTESKYVTLGIHVKIYSRKSECDKYDEQAE